ncbi:ATP-binding protein [Streptomyces sp. SID11385]|uniref:ATP-binding protein n=1 Tax=Streptomyces sp. SID11385 TaxID=2706031 RepID=UPI0013CD67EC|nr:ATP-binding protein [Streptomyces sp. SID11385]NEA39118.1 ATP-binding protein [Streptomyces sp. SID11385]
MTTTRTPRPSIPAPFVQRFSSTLLGARLARLLVVHELDTWGFGRGSALVGRVEIVVGELAANAVTHGKVPGRDFEVRAELRVTEGVLRVDVADARGERRPPRRPGPRASLAEGGYGLVLVDACADRWEVVDRGPVGKTVRAEFAVDGVL